jgi:hypothetical protein
MAQHGTTAPTFITESSKVRHMMGQALVGLAYLGIIVTFASVTFIAWLISLIIW